LNLATAFFSRIEIAYKRLIVLEKIYLKGMTYPLELTCFMALMMITAFLRISSQVKGAGFAHLPLQSCLPAEKEITRNEERAPVRFYGLARGIVENY
jgi:hypothetical protein